MNNKEILATMIGANVRLARHIVEVEDGTPPDIEEILRIVGALHRIVRNTKYTEHVKSSKIDGYTGAPVEPEKRSEFAGTGRSLYKARHANQVSGWQAERKDDGSWTLRRLIPITLMGGDRTLKYEGIPDEETAVHRLDAAARNDRAIHLTYIALSIAISNGDSGEVLVEKLNTLTGVSAAGAPTSCKES